MRMLIFGGTRFLSRAVAVEALDRGHEVLCAARGESGPVPDGATFVRIDRDAPDGLGLRDTVRSGQRFDAVLDTASMSLRWVRDALDALGAVAGHWTFVSTISVYADTRTPGQTVDAPLVAPVTDEVTEHSPEIYGGVKVASEHAVRSAGVPAFVVRAGLLVGPGDLSDRFGYWAMRMARGGRVLVPGDAEEVPAACIDVRDLAAWLVDSAEQGRTGTFDGDGPAVPLHDVLTQLAATLAPPDTELVAVPAPVLREAGVVPWSGPRSLPLWLPPTHYGLVTHDVDAALGAGLRQRPLADTAAAALAHERTLGVDRPRQAGLTAVEEDELLTAWQAGTRR
ncbi:MAG: NAD-dependent epimerase/dehydratase family protein [Pseudonocardiaceae bacterium]